MASGRMNRVMSQPHMSRRRLISCQRATKVKTTRKLKIWRAVDARGEGGFVFVESEFCRLPPPSGM